MTPEELEAETAKINNMSREEMCRLWRFAPVGHPYFDTSKPMAEIFELRLKRLGGFSSEISKSLGWKDHGSI